VSNSPMVNKKNFINPLTHSSEENLNIPVTSTDTQQHQDVDQVSTPKQFQPLRKRGNQAFEQTHQRFTGWIDKGLKRKFEKLAEEEGVSKTSLLNEGVADLLRKHMQK
jgi:hypothetical protein